MKTIKVLFTFFAFMACVGMNAGIYRGKCGKNGDNVTFVLDYDTRVLKIEGSGEMMDYEPRDMDIIWGYSTAPWTGSSIREVYIGEGVTRVGNYSFFACTDINTITLPASLTSIGDHSFDYCEKLQNINIPDSVMIIEKSAFYGCKNLKAVTIPNSVNSIGDWAFGNCVSLTSLTIPNTVTSIGEGAFHGCIYEA